MSTKISANSIKIGTILIIDEELWKVVKAPDHVKPGKGPAYVQLEMKNIKTGSKKNERISSSEYMSKAFLENKNMQYLYSEDDNIVLMDTENYDQISVNKNLLDQDRLKLLVDNMILSAEIFESEVMSLHLPNSVVVEIIETEPVIKGAHATASYKPAIISSGIRITVPQYIVSGEKIVLKTEDMSFVERAK